MPGNWITTRQVELYMQLRKEGLIQIAAAAKTGISERSARNIEHGTRRQSETNRKPGRTHLQSRASKDGS